MFNKMKNMLDFQNKMTEVKKELEIGRVEGKSSSGKVKMIMDGKLKVYSLEISDELIVANAKEQLKEDIVGCLNDAIKKSQEFAAEKVKSTTGISIPGM